MKKSVFILAFIFAISISLSQVPTHYAVELQKILDLEQGANETSGISAAVFIKGVGIWQGAAGFSHPGTNMDTTMLLGIASNTKLFTSVLCLKLQEDGILSLDDSLHKWLPPFRYVDSNITLRQLLRHQSGVDDYLNSQNLINTLFTNPTKKWTPEEILAEIGPAHFKAGTAVEYSNTNYILAGMIIEAATHKKYSELVRDSIFNPLGLNNSYLEGFEDEKGVLAHPWFNGQDFSYALREGVGTVGWAAGCIVSKPSDMVRWYDAVFNNHFLSKESMSALTDFVDWPQGDAEMGLGLVRYTYYPKVFWGHGGRTLGFVSACLFDIDSKHIVCVMMNDYDSSPKQTALNLIYKINELTQTDIDFADASNNGNVHISPNPATDYINIRVKDITTKDVVKIYNMLGECVPAPCHSRFRGNDRQVLRLDVSDLPAGVYFVHLGGRMYKFVKM